MNSVEEGYKTNFLRNISTTLKGNEKISTSVLIIKQKMGKRNLVKSNWIKMHIKTINKQRKIY